MKTTLLLIFCLLQFAAVAQETQELPISVQATSEIVRILSSHSAEGRKTNTPGFDKAAKFAESFMLNNGILPLFGNSYRDTLAYSDYTGYNLIGQIGSFDIDRKTIVLGAHLDHLGIIGGKIYNGANDNASGSTALLQIAAYLNQFEHNENIIVALFCGEEEGKLGSYHFARKLGLYGVVPSYMINFEMLGVPMNKKSNRNVYASGFEMSNFADQLNASAGFAFVEFFSGEYRNNIFNRSDNVAFYQIFGIPAHTLCAFTIDNYYPYHKQNDEFRQLDIPYLNRVINISALAIGEMLKNDVEIRLHDNHEKTYQKNHVRKP